MGWSELGPIRVGTSLGPMGGFDAISPLYPTPIGKEKDLEWGLLGGETEVPDPINPGSDPPTPPVKGPRVGAGHTGFAGSSGDPALTPYDSPGFFGTGGSSNYEQLGGSIGRQFEVVYRDPITKTPIVVVRNPYNPKEFDGTDDQRDKFKKAFKNLFEDNECLDNFQDLKDCLIVEYNRLTVIVVAPGDYRYPYCDANHDGHTARPRDRERGATVYLCDGAFRFKNGDKKAEARLRAIVLHELLHVCGCGELEAEVIENLCEPEGATWDSQLDLDQARKDFWPGKDEDLGWKKQHLTPHTTPKKFGSIPRAIPGEWEGEYIVYDCRTGAVYIKSAGRKGQVVSPSGGKYFPARGVFYDIPGCRDNPDIKPPRRQ
jgi:hypothetical protein